MKIEIFPSLSGDCLLLTSSDDRRILADGGMPDAYSQFIAGPLGRLRKSDKEIDVAYVSHIDRDHIGGILRMLDDEVRWRVYDHMLEKGQPFKKPAVPRPPVIKAIWHNAFLDDLAKSKSIAIESSRPISIGNALAAYANEVIALTPPHLMNPKKQHVVERVQMLALSEGDAIEVNWRISEDQLGIPLNPDYSGKFMVAREETIELGTMTITVLGPTKKELEKLRKKWVTWLKGKLDYVEGLRKSHQKDIDDLNAGVSPREIARRSAALADAATESDVTPPNLASLVLLVEEGGHRVLMTGDAGDETLLEYFEAAGLLDENGRLEVDVLKVPHHGAHNSHSTTFVKTVHASHYIFCGDGENENPEPKVVASYLKEAAASPPGNGKAPTFWFNCSSARCLDEFRAHWREIEKMFGPGGIAPQARLKSLSKTAKKLSLSLS